MMPSAGGWLSKPPATACGTGIWPAATNTARPSGAPCSATRPTRRRASSGALCSTPKTGTTPCGGSKPACTVLLWPMRPSSGCSARTANIAGSRPGARSVSVAPAAIRCALSAPTGTSAMPTRRSKISVNPSGCGASPSKATAMPAGTGALTAARSTSALRSAASSACAEIARCGATTSGPSACTRPICGGRWPSSTPTSGGASRSPTSSSACAARMAPTAGWRCAARSWSATPPARRCA